MHFYLCYDIKSFFDSADLRNHYANIHSKTRNFECDTCEQKFNLKKGLMTHNRIVHMGTREKLYKCRNCDKSFYRKQELSNHVEIAHLGEKKYECEACGKAFASKIKHGSHVRRAHLHTASKVQIMCTICLKTFTQKGHLEIHVQTIHEKIKKFSCLKCDRKFKRSHHLKSHMKFHDGIKDYVCNICNEAFSQKHSLLTHFSKKHAD